MDKEDDFEAQFFAANEGTSTEAVNDDKSAAQLDGQILNEMAQKTQSKRPQKRRSVQQPKLRDIELCGPHGFLELKSMFDDFKPRHKNPYNDLIIMMNKIEYWAHQLYPKLKFEDFVTHVESLSGKRMIQTTLTKMRLDMPLTDEDYIANKENEKASQRAQQSVDKSVDDSDLFEFLTNMDETPVSSAAQSSTSTKFQASNLSQDKLKRIEENKRRAQQLLAERERRTKQVDCMDPMVNKEAQISEQTISHTSHPSNQNEDAGKELVDDVMMDENEALEFIFSST